MSTWEEVDHVEKAFHILAELVERGATVISVDGVVHGFPESFALVGPRVVEGLEEEFELGILSQPGSQAARQRRVRYCERCSCPE